MRITLVLLAACAIDPPAPRAPHNGPITITVVDTGGRPIAGAHVDWQLGGGLFPCDVAAPVEPTYTRGAVGTTDVGGRFTLPIEDDHLLRIRVVAPTGESASAHVTGDTTLTAEPTATLKIAPSCGGRSCSRLSVDVAVDSAGLRCQTHVEVADGPLVLPRVPRGDVALTLRAQAETDDERALVLHTAIASDATFAPMLPAVAGPYTLHGRLAIDGKPPGGADYASNVRVECGDLLTRVAKINVATGSFIVEHLPGRACELDASSSAGEGEKARRQRVDPSAPGELVVELRPLGWRQALP